jgi:hypothetical protein
MKKLILIIFIFSLITINSEAEPPISLSQEKGKQYLPFAPAKKGKHRTWKQKPVKNLKLKIKNCLK